MATTPLDSRRPGGSNNTGIAGAVRRADRLGPTGFGAENYIPPDRSGANTADPGVVSTSARNNIKGLMTQLNDQEQQLVDDGMFTIPNKYSVEFAPTALGDSKVTKGGTANKVKVPMQMATTGAGTLDPKTNSVAYNVRTFNFAAGTPIVVILDELLKNSQYITDQAAYTVNEITGEVTPQTPLGDLSWYKISVVTKPLEFDPKRNDFAYSIIYVISTYGISGMMSQYFPIGSLRGVHKEYNYWFTGENTQVLRYEQQYNKAFLMTVSNPKVATNTKEKTSAFGREAPAVQYQAAVGGSSTQGAEGLTNSVGAAAADYLYNPTDIARSNITIVGDPAWLQQGEMATGIQTLNFNYAAFNPDGGINFDAQDIVYKLQWNTVSDYDVNGTGLANPNTAKGGLASQIFSYKAARVTSKFSKGKFEQDLEGVLIQLTGNPQSAPKDSGRGLDFGADPDVGYRVPDNTQTDPGVIWTLPDPSNEGPNFSAIDPNIPTAPSLQPALPQVDISGIPGQIDYGAVSPESAVNQLIARDE